MCLFPAPTSSPGPQLRDLISTRGCHTSSWRPCAQSHAIDSPGICSSQGPSCRALGPFPPTPAPDLGTPSLFSPFCILSSVYLPAQPALPSHRPRLPLCSASCILRVTSCLRPAPCSPFSIVGRARLEKPSKSGTLPLSPRVRAGVPNSLARLSRSGPLCDLSSRSPGPAPWPPLSSLVQPHLCHKGSLSSVQDAVTGEPRVYSFISSRSWPRGRLSGRAFSDAPC